MSLVLAQLGGLHGTGLGSAGATVGAGAAEVYGALDLFKPTREQDAAAPTSAAVELLDRNPKAGMSFAKVSGSYGFYATSEDSGTQTHLVV